MSGRSIRAPAHFSIEARQGWRACETGAKRGDNPYWKRGTELQAVDWNAGFELRAERGFEVSHLPRTVSGAFR